MEPEFLRFTFFTQLRRSIMATTNAHSSATAKVHDGGTVLHAGEGADVITNPKNLNDFAVGGVNEYGSVVVQHSGTLAGAYNQFCDPQGVRDAGGNGGLFAYFPDQRAGDRNFLIRHAGETSAGKVNSNAGWDMHIPSRSPAASPSGRSGRSGAGRRPRADRSGAASDSGRSRRCAAPGSSPAGTWNRWRWRPADWAG